MRTDWRWLVGISYWRQRAGNEADDAANVVENTRICQKLVYVVRHTDGASPQHACLHHPFRSNKWQVDRVSTERFGSTCYARMDAWVTRIKIILGVHRPFIEPTHNHLCRISHLATYLFCVVIRELSACLRHLYKYARCTRATRPHYRLLWPHVKLGTTYISKTSSVTPEIYICSLPLNHRHL